MEPTRMDVMIVGGGLAGLSMAAALAQLQLRVLVVEKTPLTLQAMPAFDGRVSALSLGSKRMLDRLGAWQHMAPYAEPILDIRVSDETSPFFLHYDHTEVGDEPFGWIVENRYTRIALARVMENFPSIIVHEGQITQLEQDAFSATLTLDNATRYQAALVIGADGKTSKLRQLAGIAVHRLDYEQTAIVCTIAHEKPHHGLAHECFLPRGPFASLPMHSGSSDEKAGGFSSLVWVEPAALAPHYLALNKSELAQEIEERIGGSLGRVQVVGEVFSYPLSLSLSDCFTTGRVALVGDAAHAVHPLAGQGINLGFRDVAVLADIIHTRMQHGLDIGSKQALADYARWRQLDTFSMAAVTHGLTRLFASKALPVKLARRLGLGAVGKLPPLKRLLMRHAMGVIGDLPALMRARTSQE